MPGNESAVKSPQWNSNTKPVRVSRDQERARPGVPITAAPAAANEWTCMPKLSRILALVVVIGLAAGAVFLATWQIPAPTAKLEKVISNDRFPR